MTSPGRVDRKHRAILDGAREVFLRSGFSTANMDAVAAAAGVSKQTVYAHFGSKEALFLEMVGAMTGAVTDRVHRTPPGDEVDAAAFEAWLRDFAVRQLESVLQPDVLRLRRLVIGEQDRFPDLARAVYEAGAARAIDTLTVAVTAGAAHGVLAVDDVARAAAQFNWLLMGEPLNRAMYLGDTAGLDRQGIRPQADAAVDTFLAAFQPR